MMSRESRVRELLSLPAPEVAPSLLNSVICHRTSLGAVGVRITELEAYDGDSDPGSHAFRGRTPRTDVMFGPAGYAYVYFTYGMHWCLNVVCAVKGRAGGVLLRAGSIIEGNDLARSRCSASLPDSKLASGPGRLARALGVNKDQYGCDLLNPSSVLTLTMPESAPLPQEVGQGPRTGVAGAGGDSARFPWRWWLLDEPSVSPYRVAKSRRR